jgi:microcystin-dependent protein
MFGSGIEYGDGTLFGEGADAGVGERGAEIKVWDDAVEKATTGILFGTESTWQRVMTSTFDSGDATELDIEINIGEADAPTVGEFWCDAILLQEGAVIMPWNISLHDFLEHTGDNSMHREAAYPIGSIYLNAEVATNPSDPSMLGFGTWELFGSGKVMVGLDSGDGDFNELEETGGFKAVSLNIAQLANHSHTQDSHNHTQNTHNHTQNAHHHTVRVTDEAGAYSHGDGWIASLNSDGIGRRAEVGGYSNLYTAVQDTTPTNNEQTAVNQGNTAVNQTTGSGDTHTNVQPYIVVYMWKRVS